MFKKDSPLWIIIAAFILMTAIGLFVYFKNKPEPVGCTEEAMVCPDGSTVGRVPPFCDFAACP